MLKDMTLGQYLPGSTVVHRLDPRTKILLVIAFLIALFVVNSLIGYAVIFLFLCFAFAVAKIPFKMIVKSIKPLMFFIILTAVLNLFFSGGTPVFEWGFVKITKEGIRLMIFMSLRLIFLVAGTSLLTYTTSPIVLTDGMEALLKPLAKVKFPAHEIAMMMSIALRFIPTIIDETDKIMKAQSARGADFESGSIFRRAKALIPILVPLFISAFRRADELATAMECRCYRGGDNRTKMRQIKMGKIDALAFIICILIFTGSVMLNFVI